MNYLLLVVAILVLLFSLRKLSMIKYSKTLSVVKEAKQNARSMLWGVLVIAAMIYIPYQVWLLAGSSPYWDGLYIIAGTVLLTISLSFIFYYKNSVKFN